VFFVLVVLACAGLWLRDAQEKENGEDIFGLADEDYCDAIDGPAGFMAAPSSSVSAAAPTGGRSVGKHCQAGLCAIASVTCCALCVGAGVLAKFCGQ